MNLWTLIRIDRLELVHGMTNDSCPLFAHKSYQIALHVNSKREVRIRYER